jgi:CubicO group peptidase (beta-lactamase class C family)
MRYLFTILILFLVARPTTAQPAEPMESLLPRFESLAQQLFSESLVPGMAIAVVYRGEVAYLRGFGVRQAGDNQPVDGNTVFQLASCSKPITSTALAALVSQGTISWDDKIREAFPEFELEDPWISSHLTYSDMLSHHSGLPEAAGDILENIGFEREDILHRLRYLPGAYDFRAGYAYSNYGFTAAAEAAARASGTSYEDLMERVLFEPLGMASTSARFEDFQKAPNRVSSHSIEGGKAYPTLRMPQAQAPAGGISSSARDLTRWLKLHLAKGVNDDRVLISEKALAETYHIHSVTGSNPANFSASGYYGLGWIPSFDVKARLKLSHSGAFVLGIRSSVTLLPEEELGIVVLTNAYPTALPEALSHTFLEMYDGRPADIVSARQVNEAVMKMLNAMFGSGYSVPRSAKPSPGLPLPQYLGRYTNRFYGTAVVRQGSRGLILDLGLKTFSMRHLVRDTFLVEVPVRTFEDLVPFEIQFVLDGKGEVRGFRQNGLAPPEPWFVKE